MASFKDRKSCWLIRSWQVKMNYAALMSTTLSGVDPSDQNINALDNITLCES